MSKPIHQAHDFQPNLNALLAAVVDQLEKTQRVEAGQVAITGTATGFAALDRMALGMQAGELIVVGARPGNGAYVFALQLMLNVATHPKRPVVFFSLRNTPNEVGLRLLALAANLDSYRLRTGPLAEQDWPAISKGLGRLHNAPIAIEHIQGTQFDTLLDLARRFHAGSGGELGLVVIDDFQAFDFAGASHNDGDTRKSALASVRALAAELAIPVLMLSQLDAQLEKRRDKRPLLCDLPRNSGLEAIADTVWLLYRPSYYEAPLPPEATSVEIALCIAKSRQDYGGACQISFSGKSFPLACYWGGGL